MVWLQQVEPTILIFNDSLPGRITRGEPPEHFSSLVLPRGQVAAGRAPAMGGGFRGSLENPFSQPAFRHHLNDLPPSAKLVAFVLARQAPTTPTELAGETRLPVRTVRAVLNRLEDEQLVESRPCLGDPRKRVFSLTVPPVDQSE